VHSVESHSLVWAVRAQFQDLPVESTLASLDKIGVLPSLHPSAVCPEGHGEGTASLLSGVGSFAEMALGGKSARSQVLKLLLDRGTTPLHILQNSFKFFAR
jgi:hypothetical protein